MAHYFRKGHRNIDPRRVEFLFSHHPTIFPEEAAGKDTCPLTGDALGSTTEQSALGLMREALISSIGTVESQQRGSGHFHDIRICPEVREVTR